MFFEICNNNYYIATAGTRLGIVKNVFAVRRELESPFRDVVPIFIRAFLLPKISGLNRFHPDCPKGYMKNDLLQRFKVGFLKGELGETASYPISSNTERWVTIFSSIARSRCGGSHLLKKALLDKRLFLYMLYKIFNQRLRYRGSHP